MSRSQIDRNIFVTGCRTAARPLRWAPPVDRDHVYPADKRMSDNQPSEDANDCEQIFTGENWVYDVCVDAEAFTDHVDIRTKGDNVVVDGRDIPVWAWCKGGLPDFAAIRKFVPLWVRSWTRADITPVVVLPNVLLASSSEDKKSESMHNAQKHVEAYYYMTHGQPCDGLRPSSGVSSFLRCKPRNASSTTSTAASASSSTSYPMTAATCVVPPGQKILKETADICAHCSSQHFIGCIPRKLVVPHPVAWQVIYETLKTCKVKVLFSHSNLRRELAGLCGHNTAGVVTRDYRLLLFPEVPAVLLEIQHHSKKVSCRYVSQASVCSYYSLCSRQMPLLAALKIKNTGLTKADFETVRCCCITEEIIPETMTDVSSRVETLSVYEKWDTLVFSAVRHNAVMHCGVDGASARSVNLNEKFPRTTGLGMRFLNLAEEPPEVVVAILHQVFWPTPSFATPSTVFQPGHRLVGTIFHDLEYGTYIHKLDINSVDTTSLMMKPQHLVENCHTAASLHPNVEALAAALNSLPNGREIYAVYTLVKLLADELLPCVSQCLVAQALLTECYSADFAVVLCPRHTEDIWRFLDNVTDLQAYNWMQEKELFCASKIFNVRTMNQLLNVVHNTMQAPDSYHLALSQAQAILEGRIDTSALVELIKLSQSAPMQPPFPLQSDTSSPTTRQKRPAHPVAKDNAKQVRADEHIAKEALVKRLMLEAGYTFPPERNKGKVLNSDLWDFLTHTLKDEIQGRFTRNQIIERILTHFDKE
ncbi:hypothetical protein Pelo_6384 [Pelomyxa schiedti]|nr:hypothetical protein Pelo_6384 [Pelomyxa schiedti]